jgi:hypothetical protein
MQLTDIKNPDERKKLLWAIVLGLVAIVFLWWALFGFGRSSQPVRRTANNIPGPGSRPVGQNPSAPQTVDQMNKDPLEQMRPIVFPDYIPGASEAKRNIFAYYEKPTPAPTVEAVATATPTPIPPLLLAGLQPSNVFARTDDFTMDVSGDKFTPDARIFVDGRELNTHYASPQQLTATVPASMIANPGARSVMVKSANGVLYSNALALNISAPPTPNYSYIGIIGTRRFIDTAILQDKNSKDVLNVQRGDVLGGRFRLTSISEKEVVLVDINLKIKHPLPFSNDRDRGSSPLSRPTPRVEAEDDEP